MRASGPLPLPGHLTPALLLPAVQLSTTALSCSCELLLLLHLTEKLPALSFSAAATTLYICATPHTSGEYLCHPQSRGKIIIAKFTNCSISVPSSSAAAASCYSRSIRLHLPQSHLTTPLHLPHCLQHANLLCQRPPLPLVADKGK